MKLGILVFGFCAENGEIFPVIAMNIMRDDSRELGDRSLREDEADSRMFSVLRIFVVEEDVVLRQ